MLALSLLTAAQNPHVPQEMRIQAVEVAQTSIKIAQNAMLNEDISLTPTPEPVKEEPTVTTQDSAGVAEIENHSINFPAHAWKFD